MEDTSNLGGVVVENQIVPGNWELSGNPYEPDFYPADGEKEPAYETGDATDMGEGLGEYMTAGGGSHDDDFMSELGETDEAFANAFGDGLKRFGRKLRSDSKKRQAKRKRKRRGSQARNIASGRGGGRRRNPRRKPPSPAQIRRRPRGPVGANQPRPGVSADVRQMDATIREFANEPIANMSGPAYKTGDATQYGNGWGEWKTAGGGSWDNHSSADGKGEGISTTTKVAIGLGVATLVGTLLFLVTKMRKK